MQWLELTIKTSSTGIDLLSERLTVLGFDSFIIDDEVDFDNFLETNKQYWDYVDEELNSKMRGISQIRLYIEDDTSAMETVSYLKDQLRLLKTTYTSTDFGSLDIDISNLQDEDWENNWKQYYQPLPVGETLIVVPQWMSADPTCGRLPILLDPGMIFGTGAHASTQMCMMALEKYIAGGERVIDFGSGSGILSIVSLLLGAKTAVGVDIDPKAEDIARENAAINNLGPDRFTAITGDVIENRSMMRTLLGRYDIVLANIVADVIIPLSQVVPDFLTESGLFICSGILDQRLEEVRTAIQASGMEIIAEQMITDWCQITARRIQGG